MTMLAFARPNTHRERGNRFRRACTSRSLVHPANSMTAAKSPGELTVSNAPTGGNREGISRKVGSPTETPSGIDDLDVVVFPRPVLYRMIDRGGENTSPPAVEEATHLENPQLGAREDEIQGALTAE